eukprot:575837-Hanusia_phi.AAC.1
MAYFGTSQVFSPPLLSPPLPSLALPSPPLPSSPFLSPPLPSFLASPLLLVSTSLHQLSCVCSGCSRLLCSLHISFHHRGDHHVQVRISSLQEPSAIPDVMKERIEYGVREREGAVCQKFDDIDDEEYRNIRKSHHLLRSWMKIVINSQFQSGNSHK